MNHPNFGSDTKKYWKSKNALKNKKQQPIASDWCPQKN